MSANKHSRTQKHIHTGTHILSPHTQEHKQAHTQTNTHTRANPQAHTHSRKYDGQKTGGVIINLQDPPPLPITPSPPSSPPPPPPPHSSIDENDP